MRAHMQAVGPPDPVTRSNAQLHDQCTHPGSRASRLKCLVYCILRDHADAWKVGPTGIEERSVSLAAEDGLVAAYSAVPDTYVTPTLPRIKAYARVVEAFHNTRTVLPMRYGCVVGSRPQISELLRVHRREFKASLDELVGCVEMGLRVLPADSRAPRDRGRTAPPLSGKAYLAGQRVHYQCKDVLREKGDAMTERIRRAFEGLYVKHHAERSLPGEAPLLSLYFLIRRADQERFRKAFGQLQEKSTERMLLTGPWPPYNFAPCL